MMPKNTNRLIMTLTVASVGFQGVASATGANAQTVDNLGPIAAASVGTTAPTTPAEGRQRSVAGASFNQAYAAGRTFYGAGPSDGTVFALTQTAVKVTKADAKHVVASDPTTDADGATLKVISELRNIIELQIPGLSMSTIFRFYLAGGDTSFSDRLSNGKYLNLTTFNDNLVYANLGQWGVSRTKYGQDNFADLQNAYGADTNVAYFIFGFQTPPAGMPKKGDATYSGVNDVNGTVFIQGGEIGSIQGNGSLTADFGDNRVTGVLSGLSVTMAGGATLPWDTVSLSGTISGDLISGNASVSQSPGNSLSLATSGKGTLRGGFYGPAADNVALIWTLRDAQGSNAVGTFGAALPCHTCLQSR